MSIHLDPKITWAQIISIVALIFFSGAAYYQLGQLATALDGLSEAVRSNGTAISAVESRTSVLEAQRIEDDRRLDEIRETVLEIRRLMEQRQR